MNDDVYMLVKHELDYVMLEDSYYYYALGYQYMLGVAMWNMPMVKVVDVKFKRYDIAEPSELISASLFSMS